MRFYRTHPAFVAVEKVFASESPDAVIQGGTVLLRAERSGTRNGRVYRIRFLADDGLGGTCTGSVNICVPRDKGRNALPCIDDGQNFSSLGP